MMCHHWVISLIVSEPLESTPFDIIHSLFSIDIWSRVIPQADDMIKERVTITMYDLKGIEVANRVLEQGSTISHIECSLLYDGVYVLHISNGSNTFQRELLIKRK
ncbi:MAG: hypothetical protein RJA11_679 [Bacteroidota bacterium]